MQLSAQKQTLSGLLGGLGYQLVVPPYQRPYAWGREQIDDLWDDLMSALNSGHFMGSLVLNAEENQQPQVIDGQQRLTTLLLLVRVLQDRYLAMGANAKAEPLYMLLFANPFAEGDEKFRLRTGDANWAVFRDYVLRRHDDPERKMWTDGPLETRAVRSRNQPLFENARVLSEKLETWLEGLSTEAAIERLDQLQQTMIQRLEFVVVAVGSAPDAFLLFETLNDRGLQLSQGDLLKNHLLSRIASGIPNATSEVERAADEWDGLVDDLGSTVDVTRFLRHFLLARTFPVRKEEVFDRFKAQVASIGPGPLLRELRTFGKLYGEFADPARVVDDSELQSRLHALMVLRAESCYPALLMARRFMSRSDFLHFARLAEILTYRYSSVCGLDAKELQAGYHRAAKLLLDSKGGAVEAARDEVIRMLPSSEQFIGAFQRQRMGAQYLARYTLQGIEGALNPGREFRGNDAVHIEHVMPQTPSETWKTCLGSGLADHPAFVQRWGNLTLLHAPLNIGASNELFADKQEEYMHSEVHLTKGLCHYLRWGLDVIDQRQEWMAGLANVVWSVDGGNVDSGDHPLQLESALRRLTDTERAAFVKLLPSTAALDPAQMASAVSSHTAAISAVKGVKALALRDSLLQLLARWDEMGADGRRLTVGAVRYYTEVADSINDLDDDGLEDDLTVVRSVCAALALTDIAPDA